MIFLTGNYLGNKHVQLRHHSVNYYAYMKSFSHAGILQHIKKARKITGLSLVYFCLSDFIFHVRYEF